MKVIIYIGILILIIFFACTEPITVDLGSTSPRLVVDGTFTTDTARHKIILTQTGDYFHYGAFKAVSQAKVIITDGKDTFLFKERQDQKGVYETDSTVFGKQKHTYHLIISNVDIDNNGISEVYTASEFMLPVVKADSIQLVKQKRRETKGWQVNCYAQDPDTLGNCYLFKIVKNKIPITDSLQKFQGFEDNNINGKYLSVRAGFLNQNDKRETLIAGDIITLEMCSISKEYFTFLGEAQRLYEGSNPLFGGPAANVIGNIKPEDKAMGYFAVYPVFRINRTFRE